MQTRPSSFRIVRRCISCALAFMKDLECFPKNESKIDREGMEYWGIETIEKGTIHRGNISSWSESHTMVISRIAFLRIHNRSRFQDNEIVLQTKKSNDGILGNPHAIRETKTNHERKLLRVDFSDSNFKIHRREQLFERKHRMQVESNTWSNHVWYVPSYRRSWLTNGISIEWIERHPMQSKDTSNEIDSIFIRMHGFPWKRHPSFARWNSIVVTRRNGRSRVCNKDGLWFLRLDADAKRKNWPSKQWFARCLPFERSRCCTIVPKPILRAFDHLNETSERNGCDARNDSVQTFDRQTVDGMGWIASHNPKGVGFPQAYDKRSIEECMMDASMTWIHETSSFNPRKVDYVHVYVQAWRQRQLIFFFFSLVFGYVEIPEFIHVPILVGSNHPQPIPDAVLLQVFLRQILEVPFWKWDFGRDHHLVLFPRDVHRVAQHAWRCNRVRYHGVSRSNAGTRSKT